jgi:hypothetical protein
MQEINAEVGAMEIGVNIWRRTPATQFAEVGV